MYHQIDKGIKLLSESWKNSRGEIDMWEMRLINEKIIFRCHSLFDANEDDYCDIYAEFVREKFKSLLQEFQKSGEAHLYDKAGRCEIEQTKDRIRLSVGSGQNWASFLMNDLPTHTLCALGLCEHNTKMTLGKEIQDLLGRFQERECIIIPGSECHLFGFHICKKRGRKDRVEEVIVVHTLTFRQGCFIEWSIIDDADYAYHEISEWGTALKNLVSIIGEVTKRYMIMGLSPTSTNDRCYEEAARMSSVRLNKFTILG